MSISTLFGPGPYCLFQNFFAVPSVPDQLWSLPYEVQMYLLLPVLFWATRNMKSEKFFVYLTIIFTVSFVVAPRLFKIKHQAFFGYFALPNIPLYFSCFLPGIWAYLRFQEGMRPTMRSGLLWMVLSLATLMAPFTYREEYRLIQALLIGATIPMVIDNASSIIKRGSHLIAKYSYGIYLFHMIPMVLYFRYDWGPAEIIKLPACIAMWFALPVIAYHLIEEPFIKLGKRLAQ
jgi:peptidoglycan/LPS O-acetylase OafA/YrhL